jgi:alkylated DNA nucleotide flippase Atl1
MKTDDLRPLVFKYIQDIPKGKVTTYKAIGDVFEVHPRKIGKIVKDNKELEKVPCYKVLENENKIGFYNGKDGIHGKVNKIKQEGIEVINGKIDKKYFI